MFIIIYLIFAFCCGFYSYSTTFAYFQRKYPLLSKKDYQEDRGFSILYGILSAIFIFPVLIDFLMSGFNKHGFKIK
jgi:hypothetical protein